MQVLNNPQIKDRILYYVSKLLSSQIKKGEDYKLKKTIQIIITDFVLFKDNNNYKNCYELKERFTNALYSDIVKIHILELPKLPKENDTSNLWKWMKFINAKNREELEMIAQENVQIGKAVSILEELSMDEKTQYLYEQREKALRDYNACINGSFQNGKIEGEQIGLLKGVQKGRFEGEYNKALDIAKSLKQNGADINLIIITTGLSEEEIEKL